MYFNSQRIANIDSLRSLAVLSVFFYHLGYLDWGFLGVDIFLVISGYVIGKILIERKAFDWKYFSYFILRRIERLLPALIALIFFVYLFSYYSLLPDEFNFLLETINYSYVFLSNLFFFFNTNYFSEVSNSPLLHLWSVALEFQFYIFLTLVILLFKKNRLLIILIILCLSILLAQLGGNLKYDFPFIENKISYFNPLFGSFYILPTRLFEFLVGVAVAIYPYNKFIKNKKYEDILDYLSFFLLLSIFFYFGKKLENPSLITLLICILVSKLILENNSNNYIRRILNYPYLSKFGLLSYSFYLWHYVLIYYINIDNIKSLDFLYIVLIFLITLCLSFFSYKLIETPLRAKNKHFRKIVFYSIFIIFIIFVNYQNFQDKGKTERFNKNLVNQYNNFNSYEEKFLNCRGLKVSNACDHGNKKNINTVLWGDSHLNQLIPVLNEIALEKNFGFKELTLPGCLPLIKSDRVDKKTTKCSKNNENIFNYIINNNEIKNVIIHAYWRVYIDKDNTKPIYKNETLDDLFFEQFEILRNKKKNIYIILGVPDYQINPKKFFFRNKFFNDEIKEIKGLSYIDIKDYKEKNKKNINIFENLEFRNISIYDPSEILCKENICNSIINGKLFYRDKSHLSKKESFILKDSLGYFLRIK